MPPSSRRRRTKRASSARPGWTLNSKERHTSRTGRGRALRPRPPLREAVRGELRELVRVEHGPLGPGGDDHQVAVPAREEVERVEHLLALGPPAGALAALLGLARGLGRQRLLLGGGAHRAPRSCARSVTARDAFRGRTGSR